MISQEEIRLKEIQSQIEKFQEPLKQWENEINNPGYSYNDKQYAKRQAKEIKKIIGNYEAERQFIIIKKHLSKEGVDFDRYSAKIKVTRVELLKSEDKNYLEYQIDYYTYDGAKLDKDYFLTLRGVVIYNNSNYEILYNKSEFVDIKTSVHGALISPSTSRYRDNSIDSGFVLNDENDLIIDMQGKGSSYHNIYHFKLKKGKYELVHTFTSAERKCDTVYIGREVNIKTDANGKKFAEYYGRLYDIESGSYFNNLAFDEIYDLNSENLPKFGCDSKDQIHKIMKENNVFLGYVSKHTFNGNSLDYVDIYGYIDTNGKLVSDLIYHQQKPRDRYPKLFRIAATNETYYATLDKIMEKNKELLKQQAELEKKKEEERRLKAERLEAKKILKEQKIRAERLTFITKVKPKTLNLNNKNNKKEQN